ncbi:probable leucine-rich repeat receptor-like protein kinase At1g35710 [Prunus avium]|uniref:Probable leucine-rich repeat receptor-like protein kinase At1g35710 n=1 Tax=Prunus avium TaxID=42229 RepID=A0A6P5SZ52_PRUAV|nr:probable leucine-rich repeat receptor-like protein kinase At1g35710 [Prunus avium]
MGHNSASASIQLVSLLILSGILSLETIKLGFCNDDHNVRCIDIERKALLKLKQGLMDPSGQLSSWVGEDCCKWSGVGCNNITGRVNRLDLGNRDGYEENAFDGEINPSLLVLKDLEYLDLSIINNFGGVQFPSFIGSLEKLKYLNLSGLDFVGVIPPNLGNLSRLLYLDLGNHIPPNIKVDENLETDLQWLATLSSLKYLNLGGVNLTKATSYWLPTVNMLPSLVELHLQSCSLPMLPLTLPSINFTSLSVLDLSGNEFTTTIPPWLFNLTKLEMLDLSYNSLMTGKLPDSLGYLKSLRYLHLLYNSFQGSIPKSIGNLTSLEEFYLRGNQMSGIIPESLWELSSMVSLDISRNTWEGAITEAHFVKLGGLREVSIGNDPPNISLVFNISSDWIPPFKLRYLEIISCQLGPKFPTWLRNQTELTTVVLHNARISGTIPDWFWQLDLQFDILDVADNQLSGRVPNSLRFNHASTIDLTSNRFEGLLPLWSSNISYLYLRDNQFSGPIPHNIGQVMPNLQYLDISTNSLSGSIPLFLGTLSQLQVILISNNLLSGEIPHFWNNMPSLQMIDLSNNNLSGEIPHFWNNMPLLISIDLSNNSLSGTIPRSLCSLTSLQLLGLSSNNFSGEFPSLKNCTNMNILDLGDNKFSGPILASIGESMPNLHILSLRSNSFTGSIPLKLCGLSALHILDFSHNNLSGNIPHCIGNLSYLKSESTDEVNYGYEGRFELVSKGREFVYDYFSILYLVTSIDLSDNKLSGEIPMGLTSLIKLDTLNLSMNHLTGNIPTNIGNLELIETLDLSMNKLSGKQFQTFIDPSIYEGNPGLSGCPLPTGCQYNEGAPQVLSGDGGEDDDSKREKLQFVIGMVIGFCAGFWGVFGTLAMKRSWRYAYFHFLDKVKDAVLYFVLAIGTYLQKRS